MSEFKQEKDLNKMISIALGIKQKVEPDGRLNPVSKEYFYQLYLLKDAGFIEFNEKLSSSGYSLTKIKITNRGHEFIDTYSQKDKYQEIKEFAKEQGEELSKVPLKLLVPIATKYIENQFGI